MNVKETIIELLENKYNYPKGVDTVTINFIEEAYVDSMSLIQFIVELEEKYSIEFSQDELMDEEFGNVLYLSELIERKMKKL